MRTVKLSEIARLLGGTISGQDLDIYGVASLSRAKQGDITFVFQKDLAVKAATSEATAFITAEGIVLEGKNYISVKNTSLAQAKVLQLFYPLEKNESFVSSKASVSPKAELGKNVTVMDFAYISDGAKLADGVTIYPFVYIGKDATIGEGSIIYPHAVIMDAMQLGRRVIIYPGAVIGSDGFGYAFDGREHVKIPQIGIVTLGDTVEIGANSTIDRATMDETSIGAGTKIDNLVMIAHNVQIGQGAILVSQVGIAGSVKVGNGVVMGGQVGIADHSIIEDNVMIAGQSGVRGHVPKGSKIAGTFAIDFMKWLKIQSILEQLPEMKKKIDKLFKKIGE